MPKPEPVNDSEVEHASSARMTRAFDDLRSQMHQEIDALRSDLQTVADLTADTNVAALGARESSRAIHASLSDLVRQIATVTTTLGNITQEVRDMQEGVAANIRQLEIPPSTGE